MNDVEVCECQGPGNSLCRGLVLCICLDLEVAVMSDSLECKNVKVSNAEKVGLRARNQWRLEPKKASDQPKSSLPYLQYQDF